jgi:hypothetical protein
MIAAMDCRLTFVNEVSEHGFRRAGLRPYVDSFNQDRTHQGHARQTQSKAYFVTGLR